MDWLPPPTESLADIAERLSRGLVGVYAVAEERLLAAIAAEVKAGLDPDKGRGVSLRRLREAAEATARQLQEATPGQVQDMVDAAARHGQLAALLQLDSLPAWGVATRDIPNAPAVAALSFDLTQALEDTSRRILRFPRDVYRAAIAGQVSEGLLTGRNPLQVQQRGWQALIHKGVTGFTDKAGRNWDLASYVEMASRTATIRAYREQHTASMVANGISLVTIIGGNTMCSKCGAWAGKTLAVHPGSPTGDVRMQSAVSDRMVTVHVAGTVAEARALGLYHPSCRCQEAPALPGVTPKVPSATYSPEREEARDRLRELERRVRKLKREQLTTDDPRAVNAKIRAAQARIREHVEDTGLARQRHREQLNLGHSK